LLLLLSRRFGFANPEALANGETGTACRGEEHDITLVWSITSGKRLVLADGQEVHYSCARGSVFDFSWTMRGNHVLKIVAHASPPLSQTPGFRQYDFFVDGQSFFTFPKLFRLGLSPDARGLGSSRPVGAYSQRGGYNNYALPPSARRNTENIAALEAPHNPAEEEAYLREAIKNSLADAGGSGAAPAISTEGQNLLLDFLDESSSAAASTAAPAPAFAALPAPSYDSPASAAYGAPAPAAAWGAPAPAAAWGAPAPAWGAPAPAYGAPAPAYGAPAPADSL
jgi:hypothetical protein